MWAGIAEYFACDGTCDFCMNYMRQGKRKTPMPCKKKPKKK